MIEKDIKDELQKERAHFLKMKNGDESGLEYFFHKYYKYLVVTTYNILGDDEMAKDIVQTVFFNFWNKRKELDIINIKAYLRKSVYNKSIDEIRKKNRKGGWTEELNESIHIEKSYSVQQNLEVEELQEKINRAISQLPDRCRTIFCLSRLENLSHKEIAKELDISVKTIENQMTKALKLMRKYIYPVKTWIGLFFIGGCSQFYELIKSFFE